MKLFDPNAPAQRPTRDARFTAINFVGDAINRTLDLREIADNALHAMTAVTKLDAGAIYIWDDDEQVLKLYAYRGLAEAFARQFGRLKKGLDRDIDAVLAGQTRQMDDLAVGTGLFRDDVRAGFRAAVVAPVRTQGFVVGMLLLGSYRRRDFEPEDIELIEVVANQLGNAMVHAQLEADLRASEEQYRSLVENSDDAIFIAGPDARPRYGNSAFERILGYKPGELAALDPYERIHPEEVEAFRGAINRLMDGQSVHNLEYRFCRKDGAWIVLQCSASVFARDGAQVEEFQFVVREVTDERRRQQQLVRRNRQLAALTMLAAVANSSLKIEEIARNTLQVALESTGFEAGAVHLADEAPRRLRMYVQVGLPAEMAGDEPLVAAVAATGEVKVQMDAAALPGGFQSLVVVPVKTRGAVLGTLGLWSRRRTELGPESIEMMTAMGNQLGIAIANARLYEAQLRENDKLAALLEISGGGAQSLELEPLLERILHKSATLLQADAAYVVRHVGDQAEVVAATEGLRGLIGAQFPIAAGLSGQVSRARPGRIFNQAEVRQHGFSPILRQANARSVLLTALIARGEVIGALALLREASAGADFSAADLELMGAFASRAAVAIDSAQLLKDLSKKNELLELLIEEAHHRIKNNLQMISGLLQLEAIESPAMSTAISRIQAIAKVHNLLSRDMPDRVDAQPLITTILETLAGASVRRPAVQLELSQVWLTPDHAVALALIVNELASNSAIHGKPPAGEPLRLHVTSRQVGHEVIVTVADNGGGLPADYDWQKSSRQGMNILRQLAQINLRGRLTMANANGGLRAELTFQTGQETRA
jgi:PAS domain S-box-containing protein